MNRTVGTRLCAITGALLLVACGGGGEGGDFKAYSGDIPEKITRTPGPTNTNADVIRGRYVVKLKEQAAGKTRVRDGKLHSDREGLGKAISGGRIKRARALHARDGRGHGNKRMQGMYVVDSDESPDNFKRHMRDSGDVEWSEPVSRMHSLSVPNDPYYEYQWNMAELDLGRAHGIATGQGVVVAVVDSGVSAGKDGYKNLMKGYDAFAGDNDASDTDADKSSSGSHGTHVAGTIAQATNNGEGVAGMAPDARILPVRVFGYDASAGGITTTTEIVAEGIVWAADNGADVINLSLGGYTDSQIIKDAVDYAYESGVAVIAASGNDGYTDTIAYPAAYPSVLSVGSVGVNGQVAYYSNQGKLLDVVAPGGDMTADGNNDGVADGILQETSLGGGKFDYALFQGTSMASPHVAGLAALLKSNGLRSPDDIYEAITQSAKDLGGKGRDNQTGYGLIDPAAALKYKPTGKGRGVADGGGKAGKAGKGGKAARGDGGGGGKAGKSGAGGGKGGKSARGGGGGKSGKSGKGGKANRR